MSNVTYEIKSLIAIIKFNRPEKLNACNPDTMKDLMAAFDRARNDDKVRVIIWEAEGRAWCVGADIKFMTDQKSDTESIQDFGYGAPGRNIESESARIILRCGKPIIAAIQGYAIAAGLCYALLADFRIAAEGAKFGFVEVGFGGPIGQGGSKILPRIVGLSNAKRLVLTAETIDASEALRIGLVDQVVPLKQLQNAAMNLAEKIAKNPPLAVANMKYSLDHSEDWDWETCVRYEEQAMLLQTQDMMVGYPDRASRLGKVKNKK